MASKYEGEVMAAMIAAAPLDMAKAQAIADQYGEKPRAIIAAAVRAGIEYQKAAKRSKSGGIVQSKEDIVASISAKVGVSLPGLEKATKSSLEALANALA